MMTKLRNIFFPIYGPEIKKFLLMGVMFFFILFNYTILRDTKDTLIVHSAGAEALSLIKLIGTVPGAILVLLIYSKLSNLLTRENLFYASLAPFLFFFGFFAYAIYPNISSLHPAKEHIEQLSQLYPRLSTLLHVYGSWSYAVFYVLSELWGSVVISLLFWQLANHFIKFEEAKRFYPLFGFIANIGLIASGWTTQHFSKIRSQLPPGVDPWGMTLNYLMSAIVIGGFAVMALFWYINRTYIPSETLVKKTKPKMSLIDSFKTILTSKHLGYIVLIIICYGISINVVEAVWKGQIRLAYGNENEYNAFMGRFSMCTGAITICAYFVGSNVVRLFGWLPSAMMTPLMVLGTGLTFFAFIIFRNSLEPYTLMVCALTPTMMAIWIGFFQNILSKATKYALFDPTKEMCYIPLENDLKVKGKAAADVVGSRVGKSGGSLAQQILLITTGSSLVGIAPYLAIVLVITIAVWTFANLNLNRSLSAMQEPVPEMI